MERSIAVKENGLTGGGGSGAERNQKRRFCV